MKCNAITKSNWHDATDLSNELFREADLLDAVAFDLLGDAASSPEAAKRFHDARDAANAKYVQAKQAWDAARVKLKGISKR